MGAGAGMGEPGNVVLAGHRTSWFRPLEAIREGDTIQLEWYDTRRGELRHRNYAVETIRIVSPRELDLLAPTDKDALTLFTCYPFGSSPRSPLRFVVRAVPQAQAAVFTINSEIIAAQKRTVHSVRKAVIGEIVAARPAGIIAAMNAESASAPAAISNAGGSQLETP